MKELKPMEDVYLEGYDVYVHPFLSLPSIDLIVKNICATDSNEYTDRKMTEDMMVLFYGTNLTKEEIEAVEYDTFVQSGLIQAVRDNIKNIDQIKECLTYMESFNRAFLMLTPKLLPLFEKLGELNESNTNKK